MFKFKPENLIKQNQLGKGGFGEVYPYRTKDSPRGDKWVVKVQTIRYEKIPSIMQEIAIGFDCPHPNILPVKGFDIIPSQMKDGLAIDWNVYMKLPRMQGSLKAKLEQHIAKGEYIPVSDIWKYFYGIACGLAYLHEKKIAHSDIKPDNILLDKDGTVKICDVGLAKYLENESGTYVNVNGGTPDYLAPEIIEKGNKLKKDELCQADLWSLGITILELCSLKQGRIEIFATTSKKEEEVAKQIGRLKSQYSNLRDLLSKLLKCDPNHRISVKELVKQLKELNVLKSNNISLKD